MTAATNAIPPLTDESAVLAWTARMRRQHPVWQGPFGGWHVFRHADVRTVLRDTDSFSSDLSRVVPGMPPRAPGMVTQFDPPEHRELRGVLSAAFTPRSIAALEPRIREVTGQLLDAAGDRFELVEALTQPLPITVIAELLGLPSQDHGLFARWTAALFEMQNGESPSDPSIGDHIGAVLAPLSRYLAERCRERRTAPGDDLISRLLTASSPGRALDDEEATNFAVTLLLAGHITTTALLGNIVRTLDEHPQVWADLHADPTRIPPVIEEVMRYRPSFPALQRATVAPVELSGVAVPAGALVTAWILAANRDPDAHADPDRFDPGRGIGGAAQLALGHGVHFCLGAPLARLEARVVLEELLKRTERLAIDHDRADEMVSFEQVILGPRRLPVIAHPSRPGDKVTTPNS
ncbi:cytochrome P450 [Amycolatopsis taiwanensis]|uniref:Cytochrome P450 n=1 Tax=Amycolatopsis taiwanensis TaxID=342230 RepID=A0A9W6VG01_9PSEU|nr:cytochrome P450 [Amycolatopsis taiwanensis]GLY67295.1 cytochrome P450 [Amycolatopsis taiwanensis]